MSTTVSVLILLVPLVGLHETHVYLWRVICDKCYNFLVATFSQDKKVLLSFRSVICFYHLSGCSHRHILQFIYDRLVLKRPKLSWLQFLPPLLNSASFCVLFFYLYSHLIYFFFSPTALFPQTSKFWKNNCRKSWSGSCWNGISPMIHARKMKIQ